MSSNNPQKPDWETIRAEYVTGTGSLRQLAKKYGVGVSAIGMRAKREHWTKTKEACEQKVFEKVVEETSKVMISNNERALKVVDTLLQKAEESSVMIRPNDTKSLKDITAILKDLKELGAFQIIDSDITIELGEEARSYAD